MTDLQLYLVVGLPIIFNSLGFLLLNNRISDMNARFDHMEKLFDAKLSRVEEVLDARLKHLEER